MLTLVKIEVINKDEWLCPGLSKSTLSSGESLGAYPLFYVHIKEGDFTTYSLPTIKSMTKASRCYAP